MMEITVGLSEEDRRSVAAHGGVAPSARAPPPRDTLLLPVLSLVLCL